MAPGWTADGGQGQSQGKFFMGRRMGGRRMGGRRMADKNRRKNFVLGSPDRNKNGLNYFYVFSLFPSRAGVNPIKLGFIGLTPGLVDRIQWTKEKTDV